MLLSEGPIAFESFRLRFRMPTKDVLRRGLAERPVFEGQKPF